MCSTVSGVTSNTRRLYHDTLVDRPLSHWGKLKGHYGTVRHVQTQIGWGHVSSEVLTRSTSVKEGVFNGKSLDGCVLYTNLQSACLPECLNAICFFLLSCQSPFSCSVPCHFPLIHHLPAIPCCRSFLSILLIHSLSLQMESLFGSLPEMLDFQRVFLQTLEERIASSPDFSTLETPSQFKVRCTHGNISRY